MDHKNGTSIVAIHVDDMLGCMSSKREMRQLKRDLESVFEIKDMGKAHWLLGVSILHNRISRMISLSQTSYVDAMVKCYRMQDAFLVHTPLEPGAHLSKSMNPTTQEERNDMAKKPYQMIIGSLIYAVITTWPDISFSVQQLSQHMSNPGKQQWEAAK